MPGLEGEELSKPLAPFNILKLQPSPLGMCAIYTGEQAVPPGIAAEQKEPRRCSLSRSYWGGPAASLGAGIWDNKWLAVIGF
jgi:hypothetical protein